MKYRKLCKRLIAFTLCITIGIQSFFSSELPAYAGQSTPSAIDSLEGLLYEDSTDISDIEMYDDTGTELVPLSPEAITLLTYGNSDDEINYISEEELLNMPSTNALVIDDISLILCAVAILGFWAVSRKMGDVLKNYYKQYAYPSHSSSFSTVDFKYIDSSGNVVTSTITQEMMEALGAKLSSIENGTYWEPVLGLSDEDKLCLAYSIYLQGYLVNIRRENIKIVSPSAAIKTSYPYYILQTNGTKVRQICFDKEPIGAFSSGTRAVNYVYDIDGNKIEFEHTGESTPTFYFSSYKIKYDGGQRQLWLDLCDTYLLEYTLNNTTGFFTSSGYGSTYSATDGIPFIFADGANTYMRSCPFNSYWLNSLKSNYDVSEIFLNLLLNSPDLDSTENSRVFNTPRVGSIADYLSTLPDVIEIDDSFTLDTELNLQGKSTFLNPAGVATWDGAIEKPTEIPTESVKPSESVQPSEGTGGDSGTITITLTSILTNLSNLFDWIKANLTASAFATAVVSALGLTALFQTITTPLSSLLNYAISISGKVADIASWDINAWIGALAAPLSHLLDIDNLVSDIANWDIDALINAVPKFLSIDTTLSALAKVIGTWNFADWPMSMAQTLRDVLTHPLSALQTATDAIAKALDNVVTWDLKTALKALENAITGALTGALAVAGITSIIDILTNIKDIALEAVGSSDDNSSDSNTDNDFFNFAKLLYILIAIIILLIILFLNCLRFIILIFSIPASTAFLNEDILKGIEYVKNLQVEKFNLSLYDIIVGVVYFLLFLAIIKAIRNKIDKIHI